jgi:hypothetical protein
MDLDPPFLWAAFAIHNGIHEALNAQSHTDRFAMQLYLLLTFLAVSSGYPANYNQRQDGKLNVHAKLENLLIVVAPSSGTSSSSGIDFDLPGILEDSLDFRKTLKQEIDSKKDEKLQQIEDEDVKLISKDSRSLETTLEPKKSTESKLLGGGIENCGPGRFRDRFGICQFDGSLKN